MMLGCSFQPSKDTMKIKLCWVTLGTAPISKSATEVMVFSNQSYDQSNPDPENQPKEVLDFGTFPMDLEFHIWQGIKFLKGSFLTDTMKLDPKSEENRVHLEKGENFQIQ